MRVLFIPWSQPTHYMQAVPLVWAFRAAGHDVRVAGQPHVAEAVKRSGLTFTPVGRDYDYLPDFLAVTRKIAEHTRDNAGRGSDLAGRAEVPADRMRKALQSRFAPFTRTAEAMAGELTALAAAWRPDLVVANDMAIVAPLVAEAAGVPLVHHLTGPAFTRRMGVFPAGGGDPAIWPDDLRALFEQYGVEPRADYAAATVDPCPERLQYPGVPNRTPVRFVPYNGPGDVPDWLSEPPARARVCVTWGTTTSQLVGTEGFLVPRILRALAGADVEVVATVKAEDRDLVGAVPANVRLVQEVPLHLLLPSCAAVVHQGGTGTMLTAAALGVPQVVVPGVLDQVAATEQLVAAGAGLSLTPAEAEAADGAAVAAAVAQALSDDKLKTAARDLRDEIAAEPSPARVVEALAALAKP